MRISDVIRAPAIAGLLVALVAGLLVLYPVVFLLQAALNTGDPEARPPTAYGFDNFAGLLATRRSSSTR